jgi:hypothetical protein
MGIQSRVMETMNRPLNRTEVMLITVLIRHGD